MSKFVIWVAHLTGLGFSLGEATWINIDETAIPYHLGGRLGMMTKHCPKALRGRMSERASLKERRGHCTFMAALCNDQDVQRVLPQVLLPNMLGRKKKWKHSEARKNAGPTIRVMENTTGWSTVASMKEYFDLLEVVLTAMGKERVVIAMDVHSSHVSVQTLLHLRKKKWIVVLIPGKFTWLLQPLDAYVFAGFKLHLHNAHAAQKCLTEDGEQTFEEWLSTTLANIQAFFGDVSGRLYFEKCGYTMDARKVSNNVLNLVDKAVATHGRPLVAEELVQYIGTSNPLHRPMLFWKKVAPGIAKPLVFPVVPVRRIVPKRSIASIA